MRFLHGAFGEVLPTIPLEDVRGIVADLGISSWQVDSKPRGFSFRSETLDMRMDVRQPLTAKTVINDYTPLELERIFKDYGEFREYKKAAALITEARKQKRFESGIELAELFSRHFSRYKTHPATQIFQAIRMEVNGELKELESLLLVAGQLTEGYLSVISFHSLEDRLVKNACKSWEKSCICPPEVMRCECGNNHRKGRTLTKKPILPAPDEIAANSRSRSAKLRIFQFGRQHG